MSATHPDPESNALAVLRLTIHSSVQSTPRAKGNQPFTFQWRSTEQHNPFQFQTSLFKVRIQKITYDQTMFAVSADHQENNTKFGTG